MSNRSFQNGSGHSPDTFKRKFDETLNIVDIENIPPDADERDLEYLCAPFGPVRRVIFKNKSEATVEMETEYAATALKKYFNYFDIHYKGKKFYISNKDGSSNQLPSKVQPCPVLLVRIDLKTVPITIEILHQIFSKHGDVIKIAMFQKYGDFFALIQYLDSYSASKARTALDGQYIYNDCCRLSIDFHKRNDINIIPNDPNCRDFTLDPISTASRPLPLMSSLPDQNILNPLASLLGPQLIQNVFGAAAANLNPVTAMNKNGFNNDRSRRESDYFHSSRRSPSPRGRDYNRRSLGDGPTQKPDTSVLLISNLASEMSDPDRLFSLLGAFGDVAKVKILYNKRDTALVQMMDRTQAAHVLDLLNNSIVFDRPIKIQTSKHDEIVAPATPMRGEENLCLTKDYSNSSLHRYRKVGSKNYQNLCRPSNVLHISNIPSNVTEDDIKDMFHKEGFDVERFKFMPSSRSMALVRLPKIEDGIKALVLLNNTVAKPDYDGKHNKEKYIRISFSPMIF